MAEIRSFFIQNAIVVDNDLQKLKDNFKKIDCCADIRAFMTGIYYSVIKDESLNISKELFNCWITTLIKESFPILEFKRNNLISNESDIFNPVDIKAIKAYYFDNIIYKQNLDKINEQIQAGYKIYIKGTDRSEKYYYWTNNLMSKGQITHIDFDTGLVDIKIIEHKISLLHGDVHRVELQVFDDFDSGIPLITDKELEISATTIAKIKYHNSYLIKIDSTDLSSNELLVLHSLLRYSWHNKYRDFIKTFFDIKTALPEATFFELIMMVHIHGNYSGYYGIYDPEQESGFMPTSKIIKNFKDKESTSINSSVYMKPKMKDLYNSAVKYIKNNNFRKGYEAMLITSYGSKNKELRTIKCLNNFGQITKNSEYTIIDENYNSFKITADDFSFRWYKKDRFLDPKIIVECVCTENKQPVKQPVEPPVDFITLPKTIEF